MTKPSRSTVAPKPVSVDNLRAVTGGDGEVTPPRDASSGLATGKRQHEPIRF